MKIVKKIKYFLEKKALLILTSVSLNLIYLLGVGLTSLLGRIISKKFLPLASKSSWQKADYQTNIRKMF